jgi:hypothetical protein
MAVKKRQNHESTQIVGISKTLLGVVVDSFLDKLVGGSY